MSINVHVTGNPISINRGKMVTADVDHCKKEFQKRRLMRLEQVRQQSKNIAEGLRNKVKNEKKMQMKEIEEEGKQKLKNWQNRKLLELQTQYKEALKELGEAHKAAQTVGDENELISEQDRLNQVKASKRGKTAGSKLHTDKFKEELEKARLEERRKLVREIENTRSHMVTRPTKSKVKKKRRRFDDEMSITVSDYEEDEVSATGSSDLSDIEETGEMEESSSCSCAVGESEASEISEDVSRKKYPGAKRQDDRPPPIVPPLHLVSDDSPSIYPHVNTPLVPSSERRGRCPPSSPKKPCSPLKPQPTYNTKISERIKHRDIPYGGSRDVNPPEITRIPLVESRTDIRDFIHSRRCHADCICCCERRGYYQDDKVDTEPKMKDKQVEAHSKEDQGTQTSDNKLLKLDNIPSQPSIKLKSSTIQDRDKKSPTKGRKKSVSPTKGRKKSVSPTKGGKKAVSPVKGKPTKTGNKIEMYDHPNRFSYEKSMPSGSFVEKIPLESLEYMTDPASDEERQEALKRREKDAQIRGKRALEKERLQKEYEEMLKKLPLLQKKERICEIYNDKPEFHMSEERLKEKERSRQNNLENVYNKLFPNLKPTIVTLPKMNQAKDVETSEASSVHSLNVAEWDVDYKVPHNFSSKEVQDIIKEFIKQKPRDRRAKLKELLKKLNIQKHELLEAMATLPKNDSLDELIKDLKSFDQSEPKSKSKSTRKRARKENEADTSIDSSQESSSKEEAPRREVGKSPRKKAKTKSKPTIIILQNTSTQTTPKPVKKSEATVEKEKICDKLHVPCDCNKENQDLSDDLCHIFIKLNDDATPEVLVKAKDKEKISKSVLTKHTTVGTQISPKALRRPKTKESQSQTLKQDVTQEKSRTWKDQFSKNSISTTSTSYLSPPDFQKAKTSNKSSFYNLRSKPQQEELSSAFTSTKFDSVNQSLDPFKPFVNKLLSMSKINVDNLSISTSNVETPSQSIIEMESNVPKQDLKQMVDNFKNKIDEIADGLSYSPDISPVPFNTSASSSSKSNKEVNSKPSSSSFESKKDLVAQYAKISDSVTKRIQTLAKMIENLREEKIKMLQASKSKSFPDKDFSTSYMDLPDLKSSSTSKSSSLEEEEIFRKLMEIDASVLNKMGKGQQLSSNEVTDKSRDSGSKSPNTTNQEIIQRLQNLKQQKTSTTPVEEKSFVPFLSDIPKLPKFEPHTDTSQWHKRPPPSKGLTAVKKFNGNISVMPHELSTIVEADSQLSTKLPSPDNSDIHLNVPLLTIPELELESGSGKSKKSPKESGKSSSSSKNQTTSNKDNSMKSSSMEIPSLITSSSSSSENKTKQKCDDSTCGAISLHHFSSSSSDDIETIESMLRSIGMDWAIPTLYKTQEALALASSSSSLDLSKKKNQTREGGTEVSLNDYLRKKILPRVSSSTMISDTTPVSFVGDYSEVSGITSSADKSRQKTSTPLNFSKSTSKSKAIFTDSDLSYIKPDTSKTKRKS